MSHAATKWAFDQPERFPDMRPSEWAVLIVLADCHNPVNGCFPSWEHIQSRTNISLRSVKDQLDRLHQRKLITWDTGRENGRRGANRYRLAFEADFLHANSAGGATCKSEPIQPAESDKNNMQNLQTNPVSEPVNESEREKRACDDLENADEEGSAERETNNRWRKLKHGYPHAIKDDLPKSEKLFLAMPVDDQIAIVASLPKLIEYLGTQAHSRRIRLHEFIPQRGWEIIPQSAPDPAASTESEGQTETSIVHFGFADQGWWALVWRDLKAGNWRSFQRKIDSVFTAHGVSVKAPDAPDEAELAGLFRVAPHSPEFDAWAAHVGDIGRQSRMTLRLPQPDKVPYGWLPSQWPTGHDAPTADELDEVLP